MAPLVVSRGTCFLDRVVLKRIAACLRRFGLGRPPMKNQSTRNWEGLPLGLNRLICHWTACEGITDL